MAITVEVSKRREKCFVVAVSGRLDSNTYPVFDERLGELFSQPVELVTFDLAGLEYISSMGLRAIFRAREALKARNGNVVLVKLQPQVMRVFELAHTMRHLPIFENIEEADRFFDVVQEMEKDRQGEGRNQP